MGMLAKDCEERTALLVWFGWHACARVIFAALLRLLVQEQAKGKEEVFFLPSCCSVRFMPTCPREPGTRAGARDGCEGVHCVLLLRIFWALTPRRLGVALPRASSVNQTKIEFLQVRNLLACALDLMT